ncbi:MAG TPA: His/Gly/Thr/Pro-type tRNA ligase C-terminal domain-containing protein, partial [Phenylobacterium sp.]|nr:His/Gly/Thr/Pro-type tRNA ligase C-terminal domain-containing protein [Phenylobacterium sp.]
YAATEDMHETERFEAEVSPDHRLSARGIEAGHIFYFGEKYSRPMRAVVTGPDGQERPIHGGSYGIGVSRLVGGIIEASHDDAGIVWPDAVAPFGAVVINLRPGDSAVDLACEEAYAALKAAGKDPLLDDTDERPGAKFAAMDLIGVPWQLIVGPKGLAEGKVEIKRRLSGERQSLPLAEALQVIGA